MKRKFKIAASSIAACLAAGLFATSTFAATAFTLTPMAQKNSFWVKGPTDDRNNHILNINCGGKELTYAVMNPGDIRRTTLFFNKKTGFAESQQTTTGLHHRPSDQNLLSLTHINIGQFCAPNGDLRSTPKIAAAFRFLGPKN